MGAADTPQSLTGRVNVTFRRRLLCIGILAIESRDDGPFKAESDLTDMKALVDDLIPGGVELGHYMRSAHIALSGRPD
ncbi:hypothetical protein [Sphingobium sp. YC-XJ3]|uniref:hypothetical protein n=1 Tax=Sphingobium sp. YC-XJ3 TaxID=3024245 RepID=UPI0023618491|nr:hypothetical protein [Sphingobium sp. YC-XJ3]WDA37029.1 hypothetical protein PO876_02130 [Sphingobium sp. YC-XJ3]